MIWENTKLLLGLLYRPVSSMGRIVDEGNWLYAAVVVIALSMIFHVTVSRLIYDNYEAVRRELPNVEQMGDEEARKAWPRPDDINVWAYQYVDVESETASGAPPRFYFERLPLPLVGKHGWWFVSFAPPSFVSALLGIAILYVPCVILFVAMSGVNASFGVLMRRDYGPLATCSLMAWAASHLPFALAGLAIRPLGLEEKTALGLWVTSAICFGVLMAVGVRMLFGPSYPKSLVIASVAALFTFPMQANFVFALPFYFVSPCLLAYAYFMVRNSVGDLGLAFRQRQGFRRSMEAATINPRDGSAHYQLGLIYQHRRQYAEAISRFEKAVEIASDETDAHFQLGRIAREQDRLQDAINHFSVVLEQDDKHSHSEIWREIGATYFTASMFTDAKEALEKFLERRAYDPEGLYYYGKTLEQLGHPAEAREMFGRCIEAVKTMPSYRYREQRKWDKLARERLA